MKLQLKHLAPYLPYELQIFSESTKSIYTLVHYRNILDTNIEEVLQIDWYKPILRPLTDLKYINEDNKHNILEEVGLLSLALNNGNIYAQIRESKIKTTRYEVYEYLFKNHFDVFGLIEKGLAINKNELNNDTQGSK